MWEEKWMQEIENKLREFKDSLNGKAEDVQEEIVREYVDEIITMIKQME